MANQRRHVWWSSILVASGLLTATPVLAQSQGEVKVCYMSHPVQDASVAMFDKWSKANGVKLVKTPMSYAIFLPKITQMLTSGTYDQCDLIWHNDDWGQIWQKYMVPVDDVQGMDTTDKEALTPFLNTEGKRTAVPMAHTAGTLFYRTDLISEADLPKTLDQMASLAERIQKEQKAKWGYVGGMSFNNTWFSLWWSMWNSGCDVFEPLHSRDNAQLAKAGWKPMLASACHQQVVEYWWDAMKTRKISPEAMTSYGRNEANAIFMSGDALFTVADSTFWGDFNDPKKSKVAGKVGVAPFPVGQSQTKPISWMDIWGWAIPKSVAADRQVVIKKMLGAMMMDEEGQTKMWSDTGGPPPNTKIWVNLEKNDPNWRSLKKALIDQQRVHSAYYFETWPAVHKAYSDVVIKALTGARADIPKVLQDGVALVHNAAAGRN